MSEARFAAFFAEIMQPCCIVDALGNVLAWNAAMQKITQQREAVGKPLRELGELAQTLENHWRNAAPLGRSNRSNMQWGEALYGICCTALPHDEWAIMIDDSAAAVMSSQQHILYTIIHDLQNPLAAIKGYAELTANVGQINERQQHFLDRVQVAVGEMSELISHLLDLAWIDAGMELHLKQVNLAHLSHDLASGHTQNAEKHAVKLILELERVPPVLCDERRMKQVINNLIGNAIKYSVNGGDVVVRVKQIENEVWFEVSDQGIGIPPEYHSKIFQRFFRVPGKFTENIDGNGLGLAICYEVLQRHGAELKLESEPGRGSRFYFSLPIAS